VKYRNRLDAPERRDVTSQVRCLRQQEVSAGSPVISVTDTRPLMLYAHTK